MKGAFDFAKAHPDKILWNGEFGTIRHAPAASRIAYMRDVIALCREHGIPYCVWNYLSTPNDGNRFSLHVIPRSFIHKPGVPFLQRRPEISHTVVRRSGKSTMCLNVLEASGRNFGYVNFDDERLAMLNRWIPDPGPFVRARLMTTCEWVHSRRSSRARIRKHISEL